MVHFTIEERREIVGIHYRNFAGMIRKCFTWFSYHHVPSRPTIFNLINKIEAVGSIQNVRNGDPRLKNYGSL